MLQKNGELLVKNIHSTYSLDNGLATCVTVPVFGTTHFGKSVSAFDEPTALETGLTLPSPSVPPIVTVFGLTIDLWCSEALFAALSFKRRFSPCL